MRPWIRPIDHEVWIFVEHATSMYEVDESRLRGYIDPEYYSVDADYPHKEMKSSLVNYALSYFNPNYCFMGEI